MHAAGALTLKCEREPLHHFSHAKEAFGLQRLVYVVLILHVCIGRLEG